MRRIRLSPVASPAPPACWHQWCEEPRASEDLEVDVGDGSIWAGVRYAREVEDFVDAESGAPVRVLMWRYSSPALPN